MNIILEGPDGSGKSTLANILLQHLPMAFKQGEGPPKYPGEMQERVFQYLRMDNTLFDRHPCVSQPIYDSFREHGEGIDASLLSVFYRQRNLFIFCDNKRSLEESHDATNPVADTPEHLRLVELNDQAIRDAYRHWAQQHDALVYNIGDDITPLITACKEFTHAT
jgi:hypothetical protein